MKLALAQIKIEATAVEANTERAVDAIETAASSGADLVALPEIFNVGFFAFDSYAREAEPLDGPTLTAVREAAADNNVGVLAGSIVEDLAATKGDEPGSAGYANASVFFDRDGDRRAVYRKHHLFGYASEETELLTPGDDLATFEFEGFTAGMTTCYDLRFPELFRKLVDHGTNLVLVPSAWPYPRVEHWMTLARARAIENLQYVATINGAGEFEDATLLGRSTVFDPWGTTLASSSDNPSIVYADITPERVESVREDFPALRDRRDL